MTNADEVIQLWKNAEDASNRGDVEAQLAHVHEGIVLHSAAAGGFLDGREAARASQDAMRQQFETFSFTTSNVQARAFGDTAILWGDFRFALAPSKGDEIVATGRFSSTWARIDGEWRDVMNHYTSA